MEEYVRSVLKVKRVSDRIGTLKQEIKGVALNVVVHMPHKLNLRRS